MSAQNYSKPMPQMSGTTKAFYDFCQQGELRFQRCSDCGNWRHVPRPVCPECGSWQWAWQKSSGRGKVFTWTVVERPMHPQFADNLPYAPVVIELEEGVRMVSWLVDCKPADIRRHMAVSVVFDAVSAELTLPTFKPCPHSNPPEE